MDDSNIINDKLSLKNEEDNTIIKHPTNTKWIVWYHNPSDKNWELTSYKDIIELSSIEDFCVLRNSWNKCLPKTYEGMFFLMRKHNGECIYPQWEDKNNRKGGYWSFKVAKDDSENAWFELMMYMIGECITRDEKDIMDINGISISPKKNFCILKIWNKDCNISSNNILSKNIKFLNMEDVLYSNHENNIQKDNIKFKKDSYKRQESSKYSKIGNYKDFYKENNAYSFKRFN